MQPPSTSVWLFRVRQLTREVVFIESLLVQLNAIAVCCSRLCIYWLLLCKNCRDPAAFEHGQYTRALKVSEDSALDRVARTRRKRLREFVVAVALVPSGTSASLLRDLLAINPATHRHPPTSRLNGDGVGFFIVSVPRQADPT